MGLLVELVVGLFVNFLLVLLAGDLWVLGCDFAGGVF